MASLDRIKQQAIASEIAQRIADARDLDELTRLVVTKMCAGYGCDAALILSRPDSDAATCWAGSPSALPELVIAGLPAHLDEASLARRAIASGSTISKAESENASAGRAAPRTSMAIPLKAQGPVLGVLLLTAAPVDPADPIGRMALENLAGKIAAAITNLGSDPHVRAIPADGPASPGRRETDEKQNLLTVYESTYRAVCELMCCDSFYILLYDDQTHTGEFVYRVEQEAVKPPERIPLGNGLIDYIIQNRQGVIVADTSQEDRFEIRRWGGADHVHSLVCVPMDHAGRTIGALSAQCYRVNAYTEIDLKVLRAFADQAALTIHNARLFAESKRKADQLAVLNHVARIVSSTIEISRLLDLIYGEVHRIIPAADTYFVALLVEDGQALSIEVLVDEGERFPSTVIPLGENLASVVIRQKAPLLLRNLAQDSGARGRISTPIGKPKISSSWLGVPLATSEHLLGLLAVASYQANAFDASDQEILQSVALQAGIAIDNARHHAQVEKQAQQDSLTGALNHGSFLTRLREEMNRFGNSGKELSLIMLDLDHFKEYNDSFGHLRGDAILRATVQAIQRNIKSHDLVGRWGGEEFAVALIQCNKRDARPVAERVRKTLSEMQIKDDQGRAVPVPTVSQGIATFPEDAQEVFALVDIADQLLYKAKGRGRDQVSVAGEL